MIDCLIIEDELNSFNLLSKLLKRYCSDVNILGHCKSVDEAVLKIEEMKPRLIFLDVVINGGTGFDVIHKLKQARPGIIFTTGYDEYAIKAIKCSAIDYLSKPIDFEELIDAVNKFKELSKDHKDERHEFLKQLNPGRTESLIIPSIKGFKLYDIHDIIWIKSEGSYSTFLIQKEKIVASKPIGHFEDLLPRNLFYRIHNRIMVNLNYILEYQKGKGGSVILKNGESLPVSERRKEGLLLRINPM
ncbi:MAG: response regulator transcription factor [Flavobacteriales bacterium]|nr:response regulator transcription factor [Flavobacteriales bacterium]